MFRRGLGVLIATVSGASQAAAESPAPQRQLLVEAAVGAGAIMSFDPFDKTPVLSFGLGVGDFVSSHIAISARAAGLATIAGAAVVAGPHVELWLDDLNWIGANPGIALLSFHPVGAAGGRGATLSDGLDLRAGHVFDRDHGGFSVGAELLQIGAFTSLPTVYVFSVEVGLEHF